ncbi:hypothetical protein PTSG_08643 [Salpingoeca rosetta]|uniref:Uncharacterized protein n=1 Tax=Salpingoeca rosetta (strain ATCC 50818 / BSB-021) TaxID=946362 RepID=F2UK96_SALR5|nr:uncharacterized protein PTSG_08643 [Salpingoeca rosetta]EGD77545.1 hypothetical protein PTSG_08643 [Salpingoeca rosetta]|eukprot:XP_004990433.1 hypothetical protein PTSG_08643 [Salpingoeca rosetta]
MQVLCTHLMLVLVPLILFIVALSLNTWAEIDDLLISGTHLDYGLFQVCGYDSYPPELNITSNCYAYNSDAIPPALKRTNHLAEVYGCGSCDHRRKTTIAFTIMAVLWLGVAALFTCIDVEDGNGDSDAVGFPAMAAAVFGVIGFAVWIVLIRFDYNKDRKWIELANGESQPTLRDSTAVHIAAAAWVCSFLLGIVIFNLNANETTGVCTQSQKQRFPHTTSSSSSSSSSSAAARGGGHGDQYEPEFELGPPPGVAHDTPSRVPDEVLRARSATSPPTETTTAAATTATSPEITTTTTDMTSGITSGTPVDRPPAYTAVVDAESHA